MSLKALEMQIALPKTFEAGKVVEQHQQQGQIMQSQLQEEERKKLEQNRKRVNENQAPSHISTHSEGMKEQAESHEQAREEEAVDAIPHPFKGQQIDLSG
ncbi:hypothetical protein [Bacillus sp. 2205SS5-2]|uniref:hypothetical protein n=1 Tax=Bacillus sp. 2205SS5-2 TaxID=3109031 RepID=UPI0030071BD1